MNIFKYSARDLTSVQKSGIIPFVTTYHPAVKNLKQLLMQEWSLIHNQPMLKNIYKTPPIISYRTGKSLKDIFVRAKLWRHISQRRNRKDTWGSQSRSVMIFSQQSLNCVKFRTKSASFPFESSRPPCLIAESKISLGVLRRPSPWMEFTCCLIGCSLLSGIHRRQHPNRIWV